MRKNSCDERTLRQYRGSVISFECSICDRRTELDRKTVVSQYGASLSFRQLRRRLTIGCSRMNNADGIDRCRAHFPCLNAGPDTADD
jgi:hypothetical protein